MVHSKLYLSLPQHREHSVQCSGTSMHPPVCLCSGRPQGTEGYSAFTTQPVRTTPYQEGQQGLITVAHRLSEHSSTNNHADCRIQNECQNELLFSRQGRVRCERKLHLIQAAQEHLLRCVSRCLEMATNDSGAGILNVNHLSQHKGQNAARSMGRWRCSSSRKQRCSGTIGSASNPALT